MPPREETTWSSDSANCARRGFAVLSARVCFVAFRMVWVITFGAGAAPKLTDLSAFEGTWSRTRIERDYAAREAEIVRVTEFMSSLALGIARLLMSRRMRPHASLRILRDEANLVVRSEADWHLMKEKRAGRGRVAPSGLSCQNEEGSMDSAAEQ